MRRRFGRVLALVLAMSLILANASAASATDSQAGVTDPVVQESTSEDVQIEEKEVLPEDVETEETTEKSEDTEDTEQIESSEAIESEEQSEPVEEQNTAKEEPMVAEENTVPEAVKELRYENEEVTVVVSAEKEGAIPEGVSLKVVPVTAKDDATKAQYEEVKKQIEAKAEKEENKVAGFLAYDITFADAQGKEVEPNGSVKVSMEYKKGVAPEGLSEADIKDTDMKVYHLEEDENGNVKDVVDMGAVKQVKELSATDKNEVKKLKVQTESFSVFTIVWTDSGEEITVHYVNDKYQEITGSNVQTEEVQVKSDKEIDFHDFAKDISGYRFSNTARIGQEANAPKIRCSKYNSVQRTLQYKSSLFGYWSNWNAQYGYHVYLVYEANEDYAKIETVDNGDIELNLFDYTLYNRRGGETEVSGYDENTKRPANNTGVNEKSNLKFLSDAMQNVPKGDINQWTGSSAPRTGLVKKELEQGFPVLKQGLIGQSLAYLFDDSPVKGKEIYKDVNHLFTKDKDGYYSFDSDENYAEFNEETNSFTVYSMGRKIFYPFNSFREMKDIQLEEFGGGVGLSQGKANHYFGMTMSADFFQPKDGRINGKDMVFEFSGDDDVWVFIDNKLILDLGGIHDEANGSINFRTGDVLVNGARVKGLFGSGNFSKTDFKNYSQHTIDFFYLERGNNASNCKLKFNLPIIQDQSVMVTKEVQAENGAVLDYAQDIDYKFNITKKESDVKQFVYDLYENGNLKEKGKKTDNNGNFTLKHEQSAVFEGFKDTDKYVVKETGASLGNGYDIEVNEGDVNVTMKDETGDAQGHIQSAVTPELLVEEIPSVVFTNRVKNTGDLTIEKILGKGMEAAIQKQFEVELKINGKLYEGKYKKNGIQQEAVNGRILLKGGESAKITGFPYGTKFEVVEQLDGSFLPAYTVSGEGIYDTQIPNESNDYSVVSGVIAGIGGKVIITNRKIEKGEGVTSLTVRKSWNDEDKYQEYIPNSIEVELYEDINWNEKFDEGIDKLVTQTASGQPITSRVTLSVQNQWTYTWENLPGDVDYVVKEYSPDGFKWTTEITSNGIEDMKYVDRVTSCKNTQFNLGKNNMLLVKKGHQYIIWTVYDLKLNQNELDEIKRALEAMSLSGVGSIGTLTYEWGIQEDDAGITLEQTTDGWKLSFGHTSVWSQFWCLQYNRTENLSLQNTIDDQFKTNVTINKEWLGDDEQSRPEKITVQLLRDGQPYEKSIDITKDMGWTYTFEGLEYWCKDPDGGYHIYKYTVKEIKIGDTSVDENGQAFGYKSTIKPEDGVEGGGVITITNTKGKPWEIYKVSSSKTEGEKLYLKDAWFELKSDSDTFYGKTDENGLLKWYTEKEHVTEAKLTEMNGQFVLSETKAPAGYQKSTETWTIKLNYGNVESVVSSNGNVIEPEEVEDTYRFYYEDTPLYSLPESGGNGIYWYMVGGVLLLTAAGMLILYKSRRKEVLES